MGINLIKLREALANMTDEEMDKAFPRDTKPKGWTSIEDSLPMMYAVDIIKGFTEHKVRYKDNTEGTTKVSDHNTWYYHAKDEGITHWFNE